MHDALEAYDQWMLGLRPKPWGIASRLAAEVREQRARAERAERMAGSLSDSSGSAGSGGEMDALEMIDSEIRRMENGWAPPLAAAYAATLDVVRAELARLTTERDEAKALLQDMIEERDTMLDFVAERDAAIARAERAERVAVWAAVMNVGAFEEFRSTEGECHFWVEWTHDAGEGDEIHMIEHDGTDAGIYRALVEACEGGES